MRVLTVGNMYPPHHLGGYELMWRSWVAHARAAGWQVRVLTTDHRELTGDPAIAEDADVHRDLRWYWRDHEIPGLPLRERLAIERHNARCLERHLREVAPDVVAWWAMGGMSLSLLERVRRGGVPAVGVVIDEWLDYAPKIDGWQRFAGRLGPLAPAVSALTGVPAPVRLAGAARWVFVSAYVRDRAVAEGLDVGDAQVAHGGIDPRLFSEAPAREWGGRLLCLGRIDPRKGVGTAIRGVSRTEGTSLRVVGSGDERHERELGELASELGIADRVRFERVPRERVPGAYAEADALLFPVSWPEPFGLVPLEAMAVGTPVVASGTGGSGEYLRDGENCLIAAPEDPVALAAAVDRLARDGELRARLRAGGLATAAAHTEEAFNSAVSAAIAAAAGGPQEGDR